MNVVVSSPLDALVFDHAIFGVFTLINNFWAWVAVITAAISYWRIRATSSGGVSVVTVKSKDCIEWPSSDRETRCVSETCPSTPPTEPSLLSALTSPPPAPSSDAKPSGFGDDGVIVAKGKFAVYYYEENDSSRESKSGGDCDGDCDSDGAVTVGREWWGSWERVMRMRTGDDEGGWYRYQDLTVINGNVVRLWDGVKSEMYSSSCCVVW